MQNTDTSLDNSLGLARALALFDGIRAIASHSRFRDDSQLDAEALMRYVDASADRLAGHLAVRGVVFPDATPETLSPDEVTDTGAEDFREVTDDEIDAQAQRASEACALALGEE